MTYSKLISKKSSYVLKTEISVVSFQSRFQKLILFVLNSEDLNFKVKIVVKWFETVLRIENAVSTQKLNCHHLWESVFMRVNVTQRNNDSKYWLIFFISDKLLILIASFLQIIWSIWNKSYIKLYELHWSLCGSQWSIDRCRSFGWIKLARWNW